jgi:RimJ/RimL family protein N-acetyltransferase
MDRIEDLWPLYRLRVTTGDIELRWPNEDDLGALAGLTRDPIHDPATMPFSYPWTDEPAEARGRGTLQWHWKARGEWSPVEWRLELVAVRNGQVVGSQGLHGSRFPHTREVESGSWVGRRFQNQGVGTAMRRAAVGLAFSGLGARTARSGAFADNTASLRISEKLGYVPDGTQTYAPRGQPAAMIRLVLTREVWEAGQGDGPAVLVTDLEPCLDLFGLAAGQR